MKVKTSITLSPEVLKTVDRIAGRKSNRSRVIEEAVVEFAKRRERAARDAREIEIINRNAERLNREIADVLKDQADL